MAIWPMAIWRRLIASGLLLLVLSLLDSLGHGANPSGEGAAAEAALVGAGDGQTCRAGPTCSPFVLALPADEGGVEWPGAPADLRAAGRSLYRSPQLSADPPPPRRFA